MAIDAHSTTAPIEHRALLRAHGAPCRVLDKSAIIADLSSTVPELLPSPRGSHAVPVPAPALTARTVAMLDEMNEGQRSNLRTSAGSGSV